MPSTADSTGFAIRLPWSARRRTNSSRSSTRAQGHSETHVRRVSANLALSELSAGESGIIKSIVGETLTRLHLMEMGLTPGTEVKVIRVGSFGGPLDVQIRGYRLSMRRDEARAIEIVVGGTE